MEAIIAISLLADFLLVANGIKSTQLLLLWIG